MYSFGDIVNVYKYVGVGHCNDFCIYEHYKKKFVGRGEITGIRIDIYKTRGVQISYKVSYESVPVTDVVLSDKPKCFQINIPFIDTDDEL